MEFANNSLNSPKTGKLLYGGIQAFIGIKCQVQLILRQKYVQNIKINFEAGRESKLLNCNNYTEIKGVASLQRPISEQRSSEQQISGQLFDEANSESSYGINKTKQKQHCVRFFFKKLLVTQFIEKLRVVHIVISETNTIFICHIKNCGNYSINITI